MSIDVVNGIVCNFSGSRSSWDVHIKIPLRAPSCGDSSYLEKVTKSRKKRNMKYFPSITTAPWQRKEWEKCFPSIEGQWEVWRRPDHWRVEEERPLHLRSLWGPRVRAGERLGGGNVLRDTFLIFYLPPAGQRPPCCLFVWSRTLLHDHWGSEGSRAGQKKCGTVLSSSWCAGGAKWDQNSWPTQTPPCLTHPFLTVKSTCVNNNLLAPVMDPPDLPPGP